MMQKQSLDFIIGYVFAKVDKATFKHFWTYEHKNELIVSIDVPKCWFGLTSCPSVTNDITGDKKYEMIQKLNEALNSLYPKLDSVCDKITPEKQYLKFHFRVKYREQVKKMTVAEVEEALGYKIEIVSDK
jgi:hypothetical protein